MQRDTPYSVPAGCGGCSSPANRRRRVRVNGHLRRARNEGRNRRRNGGSPHPPLQAEPRVRPAPQAAGSRLPPRTRSAPRLRLPPKALGSGQGRPTPPVAATHRSAQPPRRRPYLGDGVRRRGPPRGPGKARAGRAVGGTRCPRRPSPRPLSCGGGCVCSRL